MTDRLNDETANETTVQLDTLVRRIRELEARDTRRERRLKKIADAKQLAWSTALVLIVLALAILAGWVAYLAL